LLNIKLDDEIKLELCRLMHILCDYILRYRIESLISFSVDFVSSVQSDQKRRYLELKESVLPSAIMARKTKEFRCPARDQMTTIVKFKTNTNAMDIDAQIKTNLVNFHTLLNSLTRIKNENSVSEATDADENSADMNKDSSFLKKIFKLLFYSNYDGVPNINDKHPPKNFDNTVKNKYYNVYSSLSDYEQPDIQIKSSFCFLFFTKKKT
jgi:hypothetical protein